MNAALAASQDRGHEPDAVSVRLIVIAVAIIMGALLAIYAAVAVLLPSLDIDPLGDASLAPYAATSDWGNAAQDQLRSLRARETRNLTTFEWLDDERSAARIPIERAMQIRAGNPEP